MNYQNPATRRLLPLFLCVLTSIAFAGATEPTLYVSTNGDDSWSGSLAEPNASRTDGPLATVGAAKDLLRRINPSRGARVLIRAGTYHLEEPLLFTPEDSGTEGAPRSYEAYPGEKVTLSGTRALTGKWQPLGANVYAADVGVGRKAGEAFRTLFVDGSAPPGPGFRTKATSTPPADRASRSLNCRRELRRRRGARIPMPR